MIRKKEFTVIALDLQDEIFIVYIASLAIVMRFILFVGAKIVSLKINEASTSIFFKIFRV